MILAEILGARAARGSDVADLCLTGGRMCCICRRPRVPARTRLPAWASRLLCGWCWSCPVRIGDPAP
eukprot:3449004-Pyramimonas_sp.AAC.1